MDFSEIENFDWETAMVEATLRHGVLRYIATGYFGNRINPLVYTIGGDNRRIVSFRKANLRERRHYEQVRCPEQTAFRRIRRYCGRDRGKEIWKVGTPKLSFAKLVASGLTFDEIKAEYGK